MPLTFATDLRDPLPPPPPGGTVLGMTRVGTGGGAPEGAPCQVIPALLPGSRRVVVDEVWLGDGPAVDGERSGIRYRRMGDTLFGVLEADESDFPGSAPLRAATEAAYLHIFALLAAEGLPHLWRVWNYLADINGEQDGLERYRQFNIGRQDAFLASGRLASGNVPAACAIGLAGGPLRIAFLAGRCAAVPVENPRQVSAYDYPSDYGPRSPTFSRAALVVEGGHVLLFVSGTASIVGHLTVHAGDAAAQARESLANIDAVLAAANERLTAGAFRRDDLSYRVYLRHGGDLPIVAAAVGTALGGAGVLFVTADICRADLLVEIEAVGVLARGGA